MTDSFISTFLRLLDQLTAQEWPPACLYVVATPIGNLTDLSVRAWYALDKVDVIACEDTRTSQILLNAFGIHKPLLPTHQHNEHEASQKIIQLLEEGKRVALISDAGAPAVSDPGGKVVALVRDAGFQVSPIPGACAGITALMGMGFTSDENPGFAFAGFVPSKASARQAWLKTWIQSPISVIMYETPHRLQACVQDLLQLCGSERQVGIARELTKRFEEIKTMPLGQLMAWLQSDPNHLKGEFVLVLAPERSQTPDHQQLLKTLLLALMEQGMSVKDSAKIATRVLSVSRDQAYNMALLLKE